MRKMKILSLAVICSLLAFPALAGPGSPAPAGDTVDSVIDELQETQEGNNQDRFDDAADAFDDASDALDDANEAFDNSPENDALDQQSQDNNAEYDEAMAAADQRYRDSQEASADSNYPELSEEIADAERRAAKDKAAKKWNEERDRIDKEREKARAKATAEENAAYTAAAREYSAAKKALEDFKQAIKDAQERTGPLYTTPQAPVITPTIPTMPSDGGMSSMPAPQMHLEIPAEPPR